MRCNAVLGNIADCEGAIRFYDFFEPRWNLITRCARSKPRCTLLNIAAHSRTSLYTLQSRCTLLHTLLNLAAHSQTSLYTPHPRSLRTTQHCCTLSNVAAHSPNSLYTIAYTPEHRCTLSNLPAHSPTSLHTLKPRCTPSPSILAAHSPFSYVNFNKIIKAHAPLPTIGRGPQYMLRWKMHLQSINFKTRVVLCTCAPYAE